jgi:hypothetical protein
MRNSEMPKLLLCWHQLGCHTFQLGNIKYPEEGGKKWNGGCSGGGGGGDDVGGWAKEKDNVA